MAVEMFQLVPEMLGYLLLCWCAEMDAELCRTMVGKHIAHCRLPSALTGRYHQ